MKKVIEFFKQIYNLSNNWLIANGITGVLGLASSLVLWVLGYKVFAGVAFGVFATRNWDILVNWITSLKFKR